VSATIIAEIRRLAQAFREGIEKAVESGDISSRTTKSTMPYFPKGCCGVAIDLLAQYLLEKGTHTRSVHGEYDFDDWENKFPHTWLETDGGVIIDSAQVSGSDVMHTLDLLTMGVAENTEMGCLNT
jgi:hypothetical protein